MTLTSPASPMAIIKPSAADATASKSPCKLSRMVSATRAASPSTSVNSSPKAPSCSFAPTSTNAPDAASRPKMRIASAVLRLASFKRPKISLRSFVLGLTSSTVKPSLASTFCASVVGPASDANTPLSAVPPRSPWIPASDNKPIDAAVSAKLISSAAAIGATVDIAPPSCATVVLDRVAAAAKTSATLAASVAAIPKPLMMFDAISAASDSPMLDAVAKSKTAGIAAMLSLAENPAIPRNLRPSAACDALNSVVAPSSFAMSRMAAISDAVARVTACTDDMD